MSHNQSGMEIIKGGVFTDSRGAVRFVNSFQFEGVKRFYAITHDTTDVIRAWQAHRYEKKYFYAAKGSFVAACVAIDDWDSPSADLPAETHVLAEADSELLEIPPGCANGFRALIPGSVIIIFSDTSLEASKEDDYRWDLEYFTNGEAHLTKIL